ncbi:MAG: hypothetical protein H0W89_04075 [Candidatus Levybacteria bacterium]|nr:hypothetical protein [Candidatus Levybacteria bacterium]
MNILIGPLEAFYISGTIMLLAIAILVYPTLKYGPKEERPHHKSSHK